MLFMEKLIVKKVTPRGVRGAGYNGAVMQRASVSLSPSFRPFVWGRRELLPRLDPCTSCVSAPHQASWYPHLYVKHPPFVCFALSR